MTERADQATSVVLRPIAGSAPYAFDVLYTYDVAGRRTSVTHPDGTRVGYGYDPTTGRLSTITPSYNLADSFTSVGGAGIDTGRWAVSGTGTVQRSGGAAQLMLPDAGGAHATLSAELPDVADVEVALTVTVPADVADVGALNVRLRQSGADEIRAVVRHDDDDVELVRIDDGTPTTLGSVQRPAGDSVRLRVRLDGSALKVKAWDPAVAEPSTWDLEVTDSAVVAAGDVHVELGRVSGAPSASIDDVTVVDLDAPPGPVVSFGYDDDDRVVSEVLSGGVRSYGYSDGQLVAFTQDLTGSVDDLDTALGYYASGRVHTETTDSVTTTYSYDLAGQLLAADDGTTALGWTYDNLGRSATSARPTGTFAYSYDDAERWMNRWKPALNAFAVTFEGRLFPTDQ